MATCSASSTRSGDRTSAVAGPGCLSVGSTIPILSRGFSSNRSGLFLNQEGLLKLRKGVIGPDAGVVLLRCPGVAVAQILHRVENPSPMSIVREIRRRVCPDSSRNDPELGPELGKAVAGVVVDLGAGLVDFSRAAGSRIVAAFAPANAEPPAPARVSAATPQPEPAAADEAPAAPSGSPDGRAADYAPGGKFRPALPYEGP